MSINEVFDNNDNMYYGHGTIGNNDTIKSIMHYGLRCSHDSMYFTTCSISKGKDDVDSAINKLNNWEHQNAKTIIIISLPINYHIIDTMGMGTYGKGYDAFCYNVDNELADERSIIPGKYVMPEFIRGWYDANTGVFTENKLYYEKMNEDDKNVFFSKVKDSFFRTIVCNSDIDLDLYREITIDYNFGDFPLNDDEIIYFKNKYHKPVETITNDEPNQEYSVTNEDSVDNDDSLWL